MLIALLVCDQVIIERGTNKHSLVGTFNSFRFPAFPATSPPVSVYICFTNARGEYEIKLDVVDLSQDRVIAEAKTRLTVADPLRDIEIPLRLPRVLFPQSGRFEFRLLANGNIIGQRTITVVKAESSGRKGTDRSEQRPE